MDLKSNDPYVIAFYKMAESVTGVKLRSGKSKSTAPKPSAKTDSTKAAAKPKKSGGFLGLFGGNMKGAKNNAKKR
jgi:hypothetical protein